MARKILFYTHALTGGGAETVFARLAGAMADAGDDVIFAADYAGGEAAMDRPNLRHVVLGANHAEATRQLAGLLKRERPLASFSALGAQNLKHLAAAILSGRRRHCVLGYHGFAAAERKRFSQSSYWLSALTTRLAARTICVSDALLDDVRTRWRSSRRRTLRIYNPVASIADGDRALGADPPFVNPSLVHPPLVHSPLVHPPLVLACGRLVAIKRFPELVAAFASVTPSDARLAILGEGPERAAIEAAVRHGGLSGRIDLPGHIRDVAPWYARASCVVIASESESFGLTAAEALAHGVPVVSTDCGGPGEILERGRHGSLVPVGDVAALSTAITRALADFGDPIPRLARAEAFSLPVIHAAYIALADTLA